MEKFEFTNSEQNNKEKKITEAPQEKPVVNKQEKINPYKTPHLNNVMKQDVVDMKSYIMRLNKENNISIPFALNKALTDFQYKDPDLRKYLKNIIMNDFKESRERKALEKKEKELKPKKPEQTKIDFPE